MELSQAEDYKKGYWKMTRGSAGQDFAFWSFQKQVLHLSQAW